jgi:hypothetical protein
MRERDATDNLAPMADLHACDDARFVVDREDGAIVALRDAIGVVNAGQLLAACRTSVGGKSWQRGGEALPQFLGLDLRELL